MCFMKKIRSKKSIYITSIYFEIKFYEKIINIECFKRIDNTIVITILANKFLPNR